MAGLVGYDSSDEEEDIQEINHPVLEQNVPRYPAILQVNVSSHSHQESATIARDADTKPRRQEAAQKPTVSGEYMFVCHVDLACPSKKKTNEHYLTICSA